MISTPTSRMACAAILAVAAWVMSVLNVSAQQMTTGLFASQTGQVYVLRLQSDEIIVLDAAPYVYFEDAERQQKEAERQERQVADSASVDSCVLPPVQSLPIFLPQVLKGERLKQLLDAEVLAATELVDIFRKQKLGLDFYLRTHTKKDEGYREVLAFAKKHKAQTQQVKNNLRLLLHTINLYDGGGGHLMRAELSTLDMIVADSGTSNRQIKPDNLVVLHRNGLPYKPNFAFALHQVFEMDGNRMKTYVDSRGNVFRFVTSSIRNTEAANFGERMGCDGSYYQGYFNDKNQRQGNGYGVDTVLVKCGDWEQDSYRGQVLRHHSGRIYGIDISRYNHDMRGPMRVSETIVTAEGNDSLVWRTTQKVNIGWDNLRVTSLGPNSPKVDGEVNYPVDFVFVKCSEGKDLVSAYYNSDLDSCLARGIRVAPYHFYSSKSDALDQVDNFLKHGRISEATMRPMLDVEPEPHQIRQMGGIEACITGMALFVSEVEKATGRRCVLYVNQNFVEQYYHLFPEVLRRCDIWIAKYHERHPWSKHHIWQFTCKGRVNGIYGDVDLDVFNGSRDDFERWCEAE